MSLSLIHIYEDEYLEYGRVTALLDAYRPWLAELYADTMNVIHYMHDLSLIHIYDTHPGFSPV